MYTLKSFSIELARVLATVKEKTFKDAVSLAKKVRDEGGSVYFIGNGGSAAIASHMAIDWLNKANFRTHDLNNPAALTCLANDYGYEMVFETQLKHMGTRDLLVAISSSGKSVNIERAVAAVRNKGLYGLSTMSLSGFAVDNPLQRRNCLVKFHIPSNSYAIVENAHMAILHAMLQALKR